MTSLLFLRERCAALLVTALLVLGTAPLTGPAAGQGAPSTVQLVVDYGDGVTKTISDLPWVEGNTVQDAMMAATARKHGISFSYNGSGANAVLTKIDDVANEGGGDGKKNWQYWVNASYGDKSFAAFTLHAGDVVTWRFATEQGK